jgi:hypothetical protein
VAGFSVWVGVRRSGSNTGQTFLGLLARCQTLQVYQATYGSYFLKFLVLSLDEKLVIYVTVHATVSHMTREDIVGRTIVVPPGALICPPLQCSIHPGGWTGKQVRRGTRCQCTRVRSLRSSHPGALLPVNLYLGISMN